MYFPLLVLLLVMQKQKNRTKIRNEQRAALVEQPTTLQVTSILISLSKKIASQLKSIKHSAALEATAALVKAPYGQRGSRGTVVLFFLWFPRRLSSRCRAPQLVELNLNLLRVLVTH